MSKSQLGWRQTDADDVLYLPLFTFAYYQEKMHLDSTFKEEGVLDCWDKFVDNLFKTQVGFVGKERISTQNLRKKYNDRIYSFKREMGWEDGKSGNLSGKDGELNRLNLIIRNMLTEQYQEDQQKKIEEAEKKAVNETELTVLLRSLGAQSKVKRTPKRLTSSSLRQTAEDAEVEPGFGVAAVAATEQLPAGADDSTTPLKKSKKEDTSLTFINEALSNFSSMCKGMSSESNWYTVPPPPINFMTPPSSTSREVLSGSTVVGAPKEATIETQLNEQLQTVNMLSFLKECNINVQSNANDHIYELLVEEIGLDTLVSIYCTPEANFDAKYVKDQYEKLGIPMLAVHKIYSNFNRRKTMFLTTQK